MNFIRVHHSLFFNIIKTIREQSEKFSDNVHQYSQDEYKTMKCYLSPDRKSGYAIKDGDELVNVFSLEKGRGDYIMIDAIKNGVKRLDCLNNKRLPNLYSKHGFKIVRVEKNWIEGKPDVLFMKIGDAI